MFTVALEEHFTTRVILKAIADSSAGSSGPMNKVQEKLLDLDAGRLADMDAGSIDLQVLSLSSAGLEKIGADTATRVLGEANDELASAVSRHPGRLAGFATLNLQQPEAAALELERCIQHLHFHGAMVHGHTGGAFLDDLRFSPIWEAAQALHVPIYLHPAPPPKQVFDTYYAGLPGESGQWLAIAGWGWHVELGLHVLRLILSGMFDRFPNQQVIIGHMGEDLPFSLARAATVLAPTAKHLRRPIADYFHSNIHVTTSGYFTQPPFLCALQVVGIERLLYSVDYPFSPNTAGKAFLDATALSPSDRARLAGGNATQLLKLRISD